MLVDPLAELSHQPDWSVTNGHVGSAGYGQQALNDLIHWS